MPSLLKYSVAPSPIDAEAVTMGMENLKLDAAFKKSSTNLLDLPTEIKDEIFQYLPETSLVALQMTHTNVALEARAILYAAPYFASTFRLAQFTYTISQNPKYALLVYDIDLSTLPDVGRIARSDEYFELQAQKLRVEKAKRGVAEREREIREAAEAKLGKASPKRSFVILPVPIPAHVQIIHRRSNDPKFTDTPAPWTPFHRRCRCVRKKSWQPEMPKPQKPNHLYFEVLHQAIKIPIGFVFHILTACTKLQVFIINKVKLDTDYLIQPYLRDCHFSRHEWDYLFTFHPSSRVRQPTLYHSENDNRQTLDDEEILAIHQEDLMSLILELKDLQYLGVRKCKWVTDEHMAKLLCMGPFKERHQDLNFIDYNGRPGKYLTDMYDEQDRAAGREPIDGTADIEEMDDSSSDDSEDDNWGSVWK